MRKKVAGVVLAITLISGLAQAGDSFTPGGHMTNGTSLWNKAKAVWSVIFSR